MCTAIFDHNAPYLFGRTLDLERSYGESVTLTPRAFPLRFLHEAPLPVHNALLGCAHVQDGVPLYYDAVNESGLAMAALSFPSSAVYHPPQEGAHNLASFELIPWLLGQCAHLDEARNLLSRVNVTVDSFSHTLPATPLHWLIADATGALTVESVEGGLKIYENPFGVLTNAPDFPFHTCHLSSFLSVDSIPPVNRIAPRLPLPAYSRGMGGMGLTGDLSSPSRFVRALFAKEHTTAEKTLPESVSRFFHVMDFVSQPRGASKTEDGQPIETVYTSCASLMTGEYFFTTYSSRRIRRVVLGNHALDGTALTSYVMDEEEQFFAPPRK